MANGEEGISRSLVRLGFLPAIPFASQDIFDRQLENQGIIDDNTQKTLSDFGRDVRQFSSQFQSTKGIVLTGQSALSVKSANLSKLERRADLIIEAGEKQKEEIVTRAIREQKGLLGEVALATLGVAKTAAGLAIGGI